MSLEKHANESSYLVAIETCYPRWVRVMKRRGFDKDKQLAKFLLDLYDAHMSVSGCPLQGMLEQPPRMVLVSKEDVLLTEDGFPQSEDIINELPKTETSDDLCSADNIEIKASDSHHSLHVQDPITPADAETGLSSSPVKTETVFYHAAETIDVESKHTLVDPMQNYDSKTMSLCTQDQCTDDDVQLSEAEEQTEELSVEEHEFQATVDDTCNLEQPLEMCENEIGEFLGEVTEDQTIALPNLNGSEDALMETDVEVNMEDGDDIGNMSTASNASFPFSCALCNKVYRHKQGLVEHNRTHTGEKPYQCSKCDKLFTRLSGLKIHMNTHSDEVYSKCSLCGLDFQSLRAFEAHMSSHDVDDHDVMRLKCDLCEREFLEQIKMEEHMALHLSEPFLCSICELGFPDEEELFKHKKVHEGQHRPTCDICFKSFSISSNLNKHMLRHGEPMFKCDDCPKSFFTSDDIIQHRKVHNYSADQMYQCGVCLKTLQTQSIMKEHMRKHTEVGNLYPCVVCNKTFNFKANLLKHMATHSVTSERKVYKCQVCDKEFSSRNRLTNHERIHEVHEVSHETLHAVQPPYQCSVCYELFDSHDVASDHLKLHLLASTGV